MIIAGKPGKPANLEKSGNEIRSGKTWKNQGTFSHSDYFAPSKTARKK